MIALEKGTDGTARLIISTPTDSDAWTLSPADFEDLKREVIKELDAREKRKIAEEHALKRYDNALMQGERVAFLECCPIVKNGLGDLVFIPSLSARLTDGHTLSADRAYRLLSILRDHNRKEYERVLKILDLVEKSSSFPKTGEDHLAARKEAEKIGFNVLFPIWYRREGTYVAIATSNTWPGVIYLDIIQLQNLQRSHPDLLGHPTPQLNDLTEASPKRETAAAMVRKGYDPLYESLVKPPRLFTREVEGGVQISEGHLPSQSPILNYLNIRQLIRKHRGLSLFLELEDLPEHARTPEKLAERLHNILNQPEEEDE